MDHIVEVREYSVEKPKIVLIRSKTLGEDFLKAQKKTEHGCSTSPIDRIPGVTEIAHGRWPVKNESEKSSGDRKQVIKTIAILLGNAIEMQVATWLNNKKGAFLTDKRL